MYGIFDEQSSKSDIIHESGSFVIEKSRTTTVEVPVSIITVLTPYKLVFYHEVTDNSL